MDRAQTLETDTMDIAQSQSTSQSKMLAGILYGAGAGALWGLVFLAPEIASGSTPLQLTIGRYLAYGAISAFLIARRWPALKTKLQRRDWVMLVWLAVSGNVLYYVLLSSAVQNGGIAMTSLVIGFLPVVVTIVGSRDKGAVSLLRLTPSLLFCAAGALCIGWQSLSHAGSGSTGQQALGLLCAIGALASWAWYAIDNSRSLARLHEISSHEWSLLIGIATGLLSLLLIPVAVIVEPMQHSSLDWLRLIAVSLGVAVFASIVGNALWNQMSRRLPLTMVGQMILFETLFALIYGFFWEQRFPSLLEIAAFVLVVASVLSCMAAHRTKPIPEHAGQ